MRRRPEPPAAAASEAELGLLRRAVELAEEAERAGNLPVGAVIALGGEVVAEGANSVWQPRWDPIRHAEIEALRRIPRQLAGRSRELSVYTTLEPCVMCAGALFLHHVGRVVFGAADPRAGAGATFSALPATFGDEARRVAWVGPALPDPCETLFARLLEAVAARRTGWSSPSATGPRRSAR